MSDLVSPKPKSNSHILVLKKHREMLRLKTGALPMMLGRVDLNLVTHYHSHKLRSSPALLLIYEFSVQEFEVYMD
jgi:hypothetical protein